MIEYLGPITTITAVNLLGAISPGPDFVVVANSSLTRSRKAGIYTALGVGLGIGVHVAYTLLGFGFIISQSILLYSVIRLLGAGYLMYLGVRALVSKKPDQNAVATPRKHGTVTPLQALRTGFLTNALNPKATVFFVSIFAQFINPATPVAVQILYGLDAMVTVGGWFVILALLLSHRSISMRFGAFQHSLERIMGVVLIALGINVALSTTK